MLNPLGTMIVLSVVFSQMFEMRGTYPAFIITNLVAWNFYSQTTTAALGTMLWGSSLFQRIYLPRTAFVISSIGTGVVNMVLSLVPLSIIFLFTKTPLHVSVILVPFAILILTAFALGVSLLLSTLVTYFPDVAEMYPIILTAWMYLTPIIYPESIIEGVFHGWLLKLNPMVYPMRVFRNILFDGTFPSLSDSLVAIGISLTVLLVGWYWFTNKSKDFAYRV
jgi:ABC-2 type transport system permease protein